jgi:hypothetical protein
MNKPLATLVRQRFSCRAYLDTPIDEHHQRMLKDFLDSHRCGPLGTTMRFALPAATEQDRTSLKGLGTYGFIKNPTGFIVGAVEQGPKNLEDYGYLLEQAVLVATDIGLGTCWLGGSFTKSSFAKKMSSRDDEIIPAVTAGGNIASGPNFRGQIRMRAGAEHRLPKDQLFFDSRFGQILDEDEIGVYADVLELVRWAPSASNKQPWRIIHQDDMWHFYLQRTKGYGKGTMIFNVLRLADLQRVDVGIAMCHFELAVQEMNLSGKWRVAEPDIVKPEATEYIVSWVAGNNS